MSVVVSNLVGVLGVHGVMSVTSMVAMRSSVDVARRLSIRSSVAVTSMDGFLLEVVVIVIVVIVTNRKAAESVVVQEDRIR